MAHYTIDIDLKKEDFDFEGHIKADRIFNFFQEASEGHVNSVGFGPDNLIKDDLMWVLAKMHVRFLSEMTPENKYICSTFPARQKHVSFKRDYYINNLSDGADPAKALVIGTSQWCVLNFKTRRLVKPSIDFKITDGEIQMIDDDFPKLKFNHTDTKPVFEHVIDAENLDFNDHCNNAEYIKMAEEATGKSIKEELIVNFVSETRIGDMIRMFTEEREDRTFVEGRREDGTIVVQVLFS